MPEFPCRMAAQADLCLYLPRVRGGCQPSVSGPALSQVWAIPHPLMPRAQTSSAAVAETQSCSGIPVTPAVDSSCDCWGPYASRCSAPALSGSSQHNLSEWPIRWSVGWGEGTYPMGTVRWESLWPGLCYNASQRLWAPARVHLERRRVYI